MTTVYEPTGQVAPVPEYILPQDVLDLVVVETVNNPLVVGADNTAWLLLMFALTASVKNYGAVGDGVTNDTAAIDAALAAKLFVFFPEGAYRTTGAHTPRNGSVLFGVPGLSIVALDHATAHFWVLSASNTAVRFVDLDVEGLQANTGGIFRSTGSGCKVSLERVTVNANSYLQGVPINGAAQSVSLKDSFLYSRYTGAAYAVGGELISVDGGRLEMAPAATFPLVGGASSTARVSVNGVYFYHNNNLGTRQFLDCSLGSVVATGNTFDVLLGTGDLTTAFNINGGKLRESDNAFSGSAFYCTFGLKAAAGSDLQLRPHTMVQFSGATTTLPNGYAVIAIDATNGAPPTNIALPRILFDGQTQRIVVQNGSVGDWTGAFVISAQVGDGILDSGPDGFEDLLAGRACVIDFVAADHFGVTIWIQAGATVQVPP